MDPYKVFKVNKDFVLDDVKRKYKRLAVKLHPDKNPGNPRAAEMFQAISLCYQQLLEDYCTRAADRQFSELKQESLAANERAAAAAAPAPPASPGRGGGAGARFDLESFNRVFEEHRQRDVLDEGYGRWMQETPAETDVAERLRTTLSVARVNAHPTALHTAAPGTTYELGLQRVQDYSAPVVAHNKRAGLVYTDYRVAHTTTRLIDSDDPDNVRRSFASVQQLQEHRADVRHSMTEREAAAEARRREKEAEAEEARRARLRRRDARAAEQFARVHLLLKGTEGSAMDAR